MARETEETRIDRIRKRIAWNVHPESERELSGELAGINHKLRKARYDAEAGSEQQERIDEIGEGIYSLRERLGGSITPIEPAYRHLDKQANALLSVIMAKSILKEFAEASEENDAE